MKKDYTYAVARIRGKENGLMTGAAMEQLLAARTYRDALRFLQERGWGNPEDVLTADAILTAEHEKTWNTVAEMVDDMSVFDVFRIADDYHNLKAAMKLQFTGAQIDPARVYVAGGTLEPKQIERAVREQDFSQLPPYMAVKAQEAYETLLHTGDGQLCDVILDRASLEATYAAGKKSESEVLQEYATLTVVAADVKIAVRCGLTGKSLDFIQRALADCDALNTEELAHAALNGVEKTAEYLAGTEFKEAAEALRESVAAVERWSDNMVIRHMKPQKYESFTIGPLAAYILARENEIKCVRMILSGKLNGLPETVIRERLREMYV